MKTYLSWKRGNVETWKLKKISLFYTKKQIMEEKIIRPTTKPEAIKGKLLKYQGTDYCEFLPQAQGEPQYEGLVKTRNSQLKRTKGKNPKLLAQIKCNAESVDPYSDMLDELDSLFPESKNLHRNPRGRRLLAACTRGQSPCALPRWRRCARP